MNVAEKYLETLKGKKVAFVGMGVANTPCAEFLAKYGVEVYACDKRDKEYIGIDKCNELEALGVKFSLVKIILIFCQKWILCFVLTVFFLSKIRG
jgi:UDP-N-acetylmuramoylalanine--D-glutamate ligase